ncbi:L,D-transpeptidase family protein [Streptomyces sp. NPDC050085]|uniref:L,D-transpeptidase family protein n=1 Tax=Streptomyces sp. NPDC050085 TaxID=3365600 RepID=UPI0037ADDA37
MTSPFVRGGLATLLALAAALPVSPALADPEPPSSAATVAPSAPAAGPALVPGIPLTPYHPWQWDTPDQVLPPRVYTPSAAEDAVEPYEPPVAADDALVEYVPPSEVRRAPACTRQAGPYQRQVERWLKLKADGRQSAADCKAIRAFQTKQGIRPDIGFAGPVTWSRMRWLTARKNPNAAKKCPTRAYRIVCVDLPRQLMWVSKGKKVVFGPVPIRSGRAGFATRAGWHKVYWKHKNHWSTLYNTPMPYSQFFSRGQAFHAIYGSVYNPPGSRGCVNMRLADAKKLWGVLKKGDNVYVWGRKPGT